jgi:hypothetical protein
MHGNGMIVYQQPLHLMPQANILAQFLFFVGRAHLPGLRIDVYQFCEFDKASLKQKPLRVGEIDGMGIANLRGHHEE